MKSMQSRRGAAAAEWRINGNFGELGKAKKKRASVRTRQISSLFHYKGVAALGFSPVGQHDGNHRVTLIEYRL